MPILKTKTAVAKVRHTSLPSIRSDPTLTDTYGDGCDPRALDYDGGNSRSPGRQPRPGLRRSSGSSSLDMMGAYYYPAPPPLGSTPPGSACTSPTRLSPSVSPRVSSSAMFEVSHRQLDPEDRHRPAAHLSDEQPPPSAGSRGGWRKRGLRRSSGSSKLTHSFGAQGPALFRQLRGSADSFEIPEDSVVCRSGRESTV